MAGGGPSASGRSPVDQDPNRGGSVFANYVDESSSSIVITVKTLSVPFLPRSAVGYPIEFTIELDAPLGERTVSDGYSDLRETP